MSVHVDGQQDDYCSYCNSYIDDCDCDYCEFCMEHEDDCSCVLCYDCWEPEDDCSCETKIADELAAAPAASVPPVLYVVPQGQSDRQPCGHCEDAKCSCVHCPVCQAHWIDCDCMPCHKCNERPSHCTCCGDETIPLDSSQMAHLLVEYLTGRMPDYESIRLVETFEDGGACTMDDGVRIVWDNGVSYELTINQR
jgi:hypothetical protein